MHLDRIADRACNADNTVDFNFIIQRPNKTSRRIRNDTAQVQGFTFHRLRAGGAILAPRRSVNLNDAFGRDNIAVGQVNRLRQRQLAHHVAHLGHLHRRQHGAALGRQRGDTVEEHDAAGVRQPDEAAHLYAQGLQLAQLHIGIAAAAHTAAGGVGEVHHVRHKHAGGGVQPRQAVLLRPPQGVGAVERTDDRLGPAEGVALHAQDIAVQRHLFDGTGKHAVRHADDIMPVQPRWHRRGGRLAVVPRDDRIAIPRAQGVAPFAADLLPAQGLLRQLVGPRGNAAALRFLGRRLRQQQTPRHLCHFRQDDAQTHQHCQGQTHHPLPGRLHGIHSFAACAAVQMYLYPYVHLPYSVFSL